VTFLATDDLAPEAMACMELVEVVTEYFEGTLPPRARERLEAHLAECPGCRDYLEQMRETLRLLGHLTEELIPPSGREELLHLFRSWKHEASSGG